MSETGLYSSIYEQLFEYASLVDKVLIDLKDGISATSDPSRQKLGQFLISLASQSYDDPSTRLMVLLLRGIVKVPPSDLSKAGAVLLEREPQRETIDTLERFARSLEQEQAQAMARIGGRPD